MIPEIANEKERYSQSLQRTKGNERVVGKELYLFGRRSKISKERGHKSKERHELADRGWVVVKECETQRAG